MDYQQVIVYEADSPQINEMQVPLPEAVSFLHMQEMNRCVLNCSDIYRYILSRCACVEHISAKQ